MNSVAITKTKAQYTKNYERFLYGKSYQDSLKLNTAIPKYVKFYEGKQWVKINENTRYIPRVVVNITKKVIDHLRSNILGTPVSLLFRADNDCQSTEKFSKFAEYQMHEMEMEAKNFKAATDGLVKGTYCYFFYWDSEAVGKKGNVEGALRCEIIDPRDVVVANPTETDIQKQRWVIFRTREDVEAVRELCDKKSNEKQIQPDTPVDGDNVIEQENSNLVTVYTRFFRKNGEVYFEKSTAYCDIHEPIACNPFITFKKLKANKAKEKKVQNNNDVEYQHEVDPQITANFDNTNVLREEDDESYAKKQYAFHLYPFEMSDFDSRDKSIYGISQVEGMIEVQKQINFQLSMLILSSTNMSWGKYIVKEDALKNQQITNKPGQVLVDHTPIGTVGIKTMETTSLPNGAFTLVNTLIELIRTVTNSTDVITGETISKDLSGTAIAQMQAQGVKPIEQMQKRFWRSQERIGKIMEQFFKLYYENSYYSYEISEDEVNLRNIEMQKYALENGYTGIMPSIPRTQVDYFNGADYVDVPFNIIVQAGRGTQYSEIMQIDLVNNLILNGNIENMSPESLEMVIDLYPDSVLTNKDKFRNFIKNRENSIINQLKGQLQEAAQLLQQAQIQLKQRDAQVSGLNEYIKNLTKEFTGKINVANKQIQSMKKFMQDTAIGEESGSSGSGNNTGDRIS